MAIQGSTAMATSVSQAVACEVKMSGSGNEGGEAPGQFGVPRREILKTAAAAGGAAAAGSLAAPYVGNAQTAAGISLKVQTQWSEGSAGQQVFKSWCESMAERTSGALTLVPFAAGDIVDVFEMSDAVAGGVLDGMHWNPIYWASTGRMPAGAFLSSFPMGLDHPHQWDMLFDSYGGTELARELYAKQGMYFVGHVHQDLNLIHSKKPIRSLDEFKGLKLRMPGALIADCFTAIGARTVTLPGPDVYPALAAGAIDGADFAGPAINYDLGLAEVCDYIVMGPPSTPCLHQPVDLMEVSFNLDTWNGLPDHLKAILTDQVRNFSSLHFTGIQRANVEAWARFAEAGTTVTRLSEGDVARFRQVAIPLWFQWANKDKDAARVLKLHLEVMQNPSVAYLTPDDVKDYELKL
jgi:TRAP-type mannitol/chloroaromatic compound transport system substrate-binding protein